MPYVYRAPGTAPALLVLRGGLTVGHDLRNAGRDSIDGLIVAGGPVTYGLPPGAAALWCGNRLVAVPRWT